MSQICSEIKLNDHYYLENECLVLATLHNCLVTFCFKSRSCLVFGNDTAPRKPGCTVDSGTPLEICQLKDRVSFSREADFEDFGMINFYRSQMRCIFIYVKINLCKTKINISNNNLVAE